PSNTICSSTLYAVCSSTLSRLLIDNMPRRRLSTLFKSRVTQAERFRAGIRAPDPNPLKRRRLESARRRGEGNQVFENNPLDTKVDIVACLAEFVDDEDHLFFTGVSSLWKEAWGQRPRITRAIADHTTVSQLACSFASGL
ncbi:unnamed protein product, partial [Scytosiphon promiscuus]